MNAATGEPVKKVSLVTDAGNVETGQGPDRSYSANTDANGQFSMKDVKPGTYVLMGERTGFCARFVWRSQPDAAGKSVNDRFRSGG